MFNENLDLDIDQELAEIPAEYQDAFRQALERELADMGQNQTDSDSLSYLRQRRSDFQRGGFIRPDGRSATVTLSPEAYEQALPALARQGVGVSDEALARRQTLLKVGLLVLVALLLLFLAFRGRAQRAGEALAAAEVDKPLAGETADGAVIALAAAEPTPPLPDVGGADDALQTIGGLGGALTIGRPSAIELHYGIRPAGSDGQTPTNPASDDGRQGETIALAIDPSRPTPKGELRYNEATMRSDNPVAVWLFGTVLNYAIGIPDSLVRNLQPGDRISLSTDTGVQLDFVVAETGQAASYDAGRLLSQNRLGLTLFALPAVAETDVAYALANYDISREIEQGPAVYELGDLVALPGSGELQVTAVAYDQSNRGDLRLVISGTAASLAAGHSLMVSLAVGSEQTAAVPLVVDATGRWQTAYVLPGGGEPGQPLLAEFRSLPGGDLAVVGLGETPRLTDQLAVTITEATWPAAASAVVVTLTVAHEGLGAVYLSPDFIQPLAAGGDVYETNWQVRPRLPQMIQPGETMGLTVSFSPQTTSVWLQIGSELWEIGGWPGGGSTTAPSGP